jgi:hypothetical protein
MAHAIADNRPHRADGRLALHTLAVLEGILESAASEKPVVIADRCERPAIFEEDEATELWPESAVRPGALTDALRNTRG